RCTLSADMLRLSLGGGAARISPPRRVLPLSRGRDVVAPAIRFRTASGGQPMNQDAKKTALRMIPYGIYVLTADDGKGNVSAATVNWVTQTAFAPPLVVVGVKTDSGAYSILKQ